MSMWNYFENDLEFKKPAGTSRGVLKKKYSGYIYSTHEDALQGIGEVSTIPGLSIDHRYDFAAHISDSNKSLNDLNQYPALQFGAEIMNRSLLSNDPFQLYDNPFSRGEEGIAINGLIWMGTKSEMVTRVKEKLEAGYNCIKLKIGALDFEDELDILKMIRSEFSADEIEIRVDANGAFRPEDAPEKLKRLSEYELHSIEQPIKQGQREEMASLCQSNIIDIALDEELIGIDDPKDMSALVDTIQPQYLIIKPSLIGGWGMADSWITIAESNDIQWWATSALESNIGLNAIAQWLGDKIIGMPQGLGTGGLFVNNVASPLHIQEAKLWYDPQREWDLSGLKLKA